MCVYNHKSKSACLAYHYSLFFHVFMFFHYYLFVSSTMCCRTGMLNKWQKKSTGWGLDGSCKSILVAGLKGSCGGGTSTSAFMAVHGRELVARDPRDGPPLPRALLPLVPLPIIYVHVQIHVCNFYCIYVYTCNSPCT